MRGKVGAAVAIEPSTGEILMMVTSPTFDPDEMVGRHRGNNYMKMLYNKRQPMFNRAVKAKYPPGSTFKLVQGLIGLQEGVLTPADRYSCNGGFRYGHRMMKCHAPRLAARPARGGGQLVQRLLLLRAAQHPRKPPIRRRRTRLRHVDKPTFNSLGFGRKLGIRLSRRTGRATSRRANTTTGSITVRWNALTVISLSIGQGELGCTPLQMANFAAIRGQPGLLLHSPHRQAHTKGAIRSTRRFYEKQYHPMIDAQTTSNRSSRECGAA